MVIDEEDEKSFLEFTSYLSKNGWEVIEMEFGIIPQYRMYDYNSDNVKELITRSVVRFGACPVTDSYITIFKFSDKGIEELESYFRSTQPEKVQELFFYNDVKTSEITLPNNMFATWTGSRKDVHVANTRTYT